MASELTKEQAIYVLQNLVVSPQLGEASFSINGHKDIPEACKVLANVRFWESIRDNFPADIDDDIVTVNLKRLEDVAGFTYSQLHALTQKQAIYILKNPYRVEDNEIYCFTYAHTKDACPDELSQAEWNQLCSYGFFAKTIDKSVLAVKFFDEIPILKLDVVEAIAGVTYLELHPPKHDLNQEQALAILAASVKDDKWGLLTVNPLHAAISKSGMTEEYLELTAQRAVSYKDAIRFFCNDIEKIAGTTYEQVQKEIEEKVMLEAGAAAAPKVLER